MPEEKKEFMVIPLRGKGEKPKEPDFDDPIVRRVWEMQIEAMDLAEKTQGEDQSIFDGISQLCQAFIKSKNK